MKNSIMCKVTSVGETSQANRIKCPPREVVTDLIFTWYKYNGHTYNLYHIVFFSLLLEEDLLMMKNCSY